MTPEELDKARADEAWIIIEDNDTTETDVAIIAARLAREGWMPVDPDLLAVREIVAKVFDEKGWHDAAGEARKGQTDKGATLLAALAAYKAGKEVGK
jgi:dienelactone hydrolase